MSCILMSGNKIFYNFLKSILEKKSNGIFWKKTLWGFIFRLKIVFWIVFRDGRNYRMCCILTSVDKIFYNFLKSIFEKKSNGIFWKKTLWGFIFRLKIVLWMVFRDGRNYRMCCILTSGNKMFYNFLKSILEKKSNGIFWKKTLWGYIFRHKIVFWMAFRDGSNYLNVLHLNVWE